MKKFLLFPALLALVAGCASYRERPMWVSDNSEMIYEPAGAEVKYDPNPNWDVNARDISQRPYRTDVRRWPWSSGTAGSAVYTSTEAERNTGPQIQVETEIVP